MHYRPSCQQCALLCRELRRTERQRREQGQQQRLHSSQRARDIHCSPYSAPPNSASATPNAVATPSARSSPEGGAPRPPPSESASASASAASGDSDPESSGAPRPGDGPRRVAMPRSSSDCPTSNATRQSMIAFSNTVPAVTALHVLRNGPLTASSPLSPPRLMSCSGGTAKYPAYPSCDPCVCSTKMNTRAAQPSVMLCTRGTIV
jgi:hypothetical protein